MPPSDRLPLRQQITRLLPHKLWSYLLVTTGCLAVISLLAFGRLHSEFGIEAMRSTQDYKARLDRIDALLVAVLNAETGVRGYLVSGRNPVPVDVALRVRELGGKVIALTSMAYTTGVSSRHPSGQNLYQVADIVIDNCGCPGDGAVTLPGLQEKVGPTSTAVGAALLNAMMTQAVQYMLEAGATPPVFMSANVEGGDEHNAKVLAENAGRIHYM